MLRIRKIVASSTAITLHVEGRIVAEWVALLEQECGQALRETARVQLDLAGVTFIDARGVKALRRIATDGVVIVNSRELIDALLKSDGGEP